MSKSWNFNIHHCLLPLYICLWRAIIFLHLPIPILHLLSSTLHYLVSKVFISYYAFDNSSKFCMNFFYILWDFIIKQLVPVFLESTIADSFPGLNRPINSILILIDFRTTIEENCGCHCLYMGWSQSFR